jgi:hypothetical protein
MTKEKIVVNNHIYYITLNEQTQMYAMKLRNLYQESYNDMGSFDDISSEISTTVNNLLKHGISPEVTEDDMDGVVKQVLKIFEKSSRKK